MKQPKQLEIDKPCVVLRPEYSFHGVVVDIHKDRVRVAGPGSIIGSKFDEWFPIHCLKIHVLPL